jgi:hypothetical protein
VVEAVRREAISRSGYFEASLIRGVAFSVPVLLGLLRVVEDAGKANIESLALAVPMPWVRFYSKSMPCNRVRE